jgi:glyoxylase-like metal-dependent hydrolase (beta-lactamase superfamily II)
MAGLSWQVLAAPGHDPHSLIFYAPAEGLLISADALWGNGFGAIFGELQGTGGFAEQAAVLQLISELDVRLVIPGHGAPFTDVAAALTRARDKLAYLATEPKRNTRQIIRVLIAFLLLDERAISETALLQRYANSSIMQAASEQLNEPLAVLLKTATCELVG